MTRFPGATVFQTYSWARAYSEWSPRDIPVFIYVRDRADNIVAQLLLFVANEFERRGARYNRILRFAPSRLGLGNRIRWSYGPLVLDRSRSSDILNAILCAVTGIARDRNVVLVDGASPPLTYSSETYLDAFRKQSKRIMEWGTFITDVTRDEQTIWENLNKKVRNDVRRAEKEIVVKEVTSDELLLEYASLLLRFNAVRRRIFSKPEIANRWYRIFWKWGNQCQSTQKLFLAYKGNQPCAGLVVNGFNGNVTQHDVISDGSKGNLGGPLLTWHAIKWAHHTGFKTFDFVGVNPSSSASEKERAIYFYKSKWAGVYRTHYRILKIMKPFKEKLGWISEKALQRFQAVGI
jgi:hypothetical protein